MGNSGKIYVNPREKAYGKYKQFSLNRIKNLVTRGQKYAAEGKTFDDLVYSGKLKDLSFKEQMMVDLGMDYPVWDVPEIKTYYRIGEPSIDTMEGFTTTLIISWRIESRRASRLY